MSALPLFALLTCYVVIDATAQGGIALRNRHYVPMSEQPAINTDLHLLLPLLYLVLLVAVWKWQGWCWPVSGILLRLALFDPVMNLRKHDPLFAVGTSARLDRALRFLSRGHAEVLSAALRLVALGGAAALLLR